MRRSAAALGLAALALGSCGDAPRGLDTGASAEARGAPAADAFCAEHGVLEAVCTRCNPKLIPIFQERGDWCAEHGFPESFCPQCHPERGGRPALAVGQGAPPTGMAVRLATPETARMAGIETAEAQALAAAEELSVVGTIAYDPARRAEVNARAPGVVRAVLVEVGQRVEPGAPLIRIESAQVGAEQSRLLAAASRSEVAQAAFDRARALSDRGLSSERDLLAARLELDAARAEQAAAEAELELVGAEAGSGGTFALAAPLGGTCLALRATVGRMVGAEEVLCELADTGVMWAELDVPERALARVVPGQEVILTADALGEREFKGRIDYLAPEIDRHTRTAKARVRLPNADGALRANLFVRARILLGPQQSRVLVPRGALQVAKGAAIVFVELAPGSYEVRRVSGAVLRGEGVALDSGVLPGERVVDAGSFLLKTETLKGEIGAGCCAAD